MEEMADDKLGWVSAGGNTQLQRKGSEVGAMRREKSRQRTLHH